MQTHEVFNQVPPLENVNLLDIDCLLQDIIARHELKWALSKLREYGGLMGSAKWIEKGHQANKNIPSFKSHDAQGIRIDQIDYHPAYHEIMQLGIAHEVHSLPWSSSDQDAHIARMIKYYLHAQNEGGSGCPLTMTFSSFPAIKHHLPDSEIWIKGILSTQYDPANKPWFEKNGLTIGMAMTEKQGGTDVRANTTIAKPEGMRKAGSMYRLNGHKWFCSAPMCDAFLTLAQADGGLSCFLLPRWKPDGTKNEFRIQRLKDKLGNRSNASSEIEYEDAFAWLMGEEGRGVQTILEMVGLTRYDCMIGSSALIRRAVTEVINHINHRTVYGQKLTDHPLMQNVVSDLCLESEASLALTYRAALCLDNSHDPGEQLLLRLLMPVGKYWITKRAGIALAEAMECLGGNGYIEESILPRLYREAPVNAIWEGSGNVQCLDVLRAIRKSPDVLEIYMNELASASGRNQEFDLYLSKLKSDLPALLTQEFTARTLTEKLALAMQAAQLLKFENQVIAQAFCAARLGDSTGWLFGNIPPEVPAKELLKRYQFPL